MRIPRTGLSALKRRLFHRASPGAAPGTLTTDPSAPSPVINLIAYGPGDVQEVRLDRPEQLKEHLLGRMPVTWVNVDGLGDGTILREIAEMFEIHRLALEDVANVHQRAKVEPYDQHLFVVLRMLGGGDPPDTEQVSFFLGQGFVLTFQERPGDSFDPVRDRIRHGKGRIRKAGADYLLYALTDAVIDHYFPALERIGDRLDVLEERILGQTDPKVIESVHAVKKDMLLIRRAVWPTREVFNTLLRDETSWIEDETRNYMRDCYDHAIQIIDMLESQREVASSLTDLHMTSLSNRMNEIMKVLAIIATIFIPLSFIAGLYGMNFDTEVSPWNLPELSWYWGYPMVLGLMVVIGLGQIVYFWRKGWIGSS